MDVINGPAFRTETQRVSRFDPTEFCKPLVQYVPVLDSNIPTIEDALAEDVVEDFDLNETEPAENGGGVVYSIIVKSYHEGDVGEMYRIGSQESFVDIYKDYASRLDVTAVQIKMYHDNKYVASTAYPAQVGVGSGSVLYVEGANGVVNTNTRIKRFYLKNSGHRNKIKMRVQGKLDTPLCRLFHVWGVKYGIDPSNLSFYHEDVALGPQTTIRDAGILNGDKVIVVPNMCG